MGLEILFKGRQGEIEKGGGGGREEPGKIFRKREKKEIMLD